MTRGRLSWRLAFTAGATIAMLGCVPAHAFIVIGPTQVPDAYRTQDINVPDPTLTLNQGAPRHVRLRSPIDGVIVRWRTYSGFIGAGSTVQVRVLVPEAGGNFRVVRSGPIETPAGTDFGKATEVSFAARIPIPAGAQIGVQRTKPGGQGNLITRVFDQVNPSPWVEGWYTGGSPLPPADGAAGVPQTVDGSGTSLESFFPESAIVEPDIDQDDFGDETQDRCPGTAGGDAGCPTGAYAQPAAPARGAAWLGPNFDLDPANVVTNPRPTSSVVLNTTASPGTELRARFRGVVTRWSFYTGDVTGSASAQLRILRKLSDDYYVVASGPLETLAPGTGPATLRSFSSHIAIAPGDEVAVGLQRDASATLQLSTVQTDISPSTWVWGQFTGTTGNERVPVDGATGYPSQAATTFLPISAVVERDADGDLFGDNTEDRCLDSAGPDAGCPAAPTPPATNPQQQPTVIVNTIVPASANAIIDIASVHFTKGRKGLSVAVSCPVQKAQACKGRLNARTADKLRQSPAKRKRLIGLGRKSFSVAQGATKTLQLKVPASARRAIRSLKKVKLVLAITATTTGAATAR